MSPLLRKFLGLNWVIVITMAGLLAFGVFAIYSSSWMRTGSKLSSYWLVQMKFIGFGSVVFLAVSLIDYRWIRWLAVPTYVAGVVFLIVVRFIGEVQSGAASWLKLGPLPQFQPSQIAIVGGIMTLAVVLADLQRLHPIFRNHLLRLGLSLGLVMIPFGLVATEPDVGSACVWGPVAASMLLVANIPFRYLIVLSLLALIAMPLTYWFVLTDYQRGRIQNYFLVMKGLEIDTKGSGYDTSNLVTAIGSAGFEGKGHKGSRIKRQNPDAKTFVELGVISKTVIINDYIFSVIGEEHGFRGAVLMITAFLLLLLQCLFVAFYSRDQLGRLIVVGCVALFFVHIFMNIGMTIQLVPITGLPLPFISYGRTFLLICMFMLGLVESVWIHRNNEEKSNDSSLFY